MPLPSSLTYNELNGEEIKQVLIERFRTILNDVPYLQRHLTLPRIKMSLSVTLDRYAETNSPEQSVITDRLTIINSDPSDLDTDQLSLALAESTTLSSTVNSAPVRGGQPAGQIREEHGIVDPGPVRGDRAIGGQFFHQDYVPVPAEQPRKILEGTVNEETPGVIIDRKGAGQAYAGMHTRDGSTSVVMDQGRAGLREGNFNRSELFRRKS